MTDVNATTTAAAITPAAAKNDKRMSDLMKQVVKYGEESGAGKDSLPKLALAIIHAADAGVLNTTDKDDKGNDHAAQIYAKYAASESKKVIHEVGGVKANVSKLRQLINVGNMTTVDAVELFQEAFEARTAMIADSEKVKSAYPYFVDVARSQLKSDKPLTRADLEKLAVKDEPAPKELEKVLKGLMDTLEALITDGYGKDKLKDNNENTEAAYQLVKDRYTGIAKAKATMVLRQKAAALGLTLA